MPSTMHTTIEDGDSLSVELPNGIGVVTVHTARRDVRSGDPMVAVEIVSDTLDTPAEDGRYYETRYDSMQDTVYLTGRLPKPDPDSTRSCGCGGIGRHGVDHTED